MLEQTHTAEQMEQPLFSLHAVSSSTFGQSRVCRLSPLSSLAAPINSPARPVLISGGAVGVQAVAWHGLQGWPAAAAPLGRPRARLSCVSPTLPASIISMPGRTCGKPPARMRCANIGVHVVLCMLTSHQFPTILVDLLYCS